MDTISDSEFLRLNSCQVFDEKIDEETLRKRFPGLPKFMYPLIVNYMENDGEVDPELQHKIKLKYNKKYREEKLGEHSIGWGISSLLKEKRVYVNGHFPFIVKDHEVNQCDICKSNYKNYVLNKKEEEEELKRQSEEEPFVMDMDEYKRHQDFKNRQYRKQIYCELNGKQLCRIYKVDCSEWVNYIDLFPLIENSPFLNKRFDEYIERGGELLTGVIDEKLYEYFSDEDMD